MLLSARQVIVLSLLFISYAVVYLSKRSASEWLQHLLPADAKAEDRGVFSSKWEFFGGISKVGCGFLVDAFSPSLVLVGSLLTIGLSHILLLTPESLSGQSNVWGVNGFVSAFAWPALARIFLAWFPDPRTRGKYYAILALSQNVGAALCPLLLPPLARQFGWKSDVLTPGIACVAVALLLLVAVRDAPAAAEAVVSSATAVPEPSPTTVASSASTIASLKKQPGVSEGSDETSVAGEASREATARSNAKQTKAVVASPSTTSTSSSSTNSPPKTTILGAVLDIVSSPIMWMLGVNYFFNTLVRNALTEMPGRLLGKNSMGLAKTTIGTCVVVYEVGAMAGGLAAGFISDQYFLGRRGPVMVLASFSAAVPLLLLLFLLPQEAAAGTSAAPPPPLDQSYFNGSGGVILAYGIAGLLAFGPHVLNGLATRELASPHVQSSASGFTKALGQLGGVAAGAPLGSLIDAFGWRSAVQALVLACACAGCVAIPLWNVTSGNSKTSTKAISSEKEEREKKAQ